MTRMLCHKVAALAATMALLLVTPLTDGLAGDLDAFVVNLASEPDRVCVNDGSGNFADSGQLLSSSGSNDVALGDIDGDGDLDAFIANGFHAVGIVDPNEVWLNDGSGNFTDSGQRLGGSPSYRVALEDLDTDGHLDAFVTNIDNPGKANKVWLNDGSGNFDSGQSLGDSFSYGLAVADLDGDRDLDAVVANIDGSSRVWLNDGSGHFSDSGQSPGSADMLSVAIGDMDGDGDLDAFFGGRDSANEVWLNDGSGFFSDTNQRLGGSENHNDVWLGDLDGDGDLDAFVANGFGPGAGGGDPGQPNRVWLNDGLGQFTDSGLRLGAFGSYSVALGDLDDDGDLDAFVANLTEHPNIVWLNDGSGNFVDSGQNLSCGIRSHAVALGDLDEDDVIQLVIDIKPGSDPNSINLGSAGVIPVAILSTGSFDATIDLDQDTISLAGARVKMVGKSNHLLCHEEFVNGDDLLDLVCQVETVQFMIEEGESVAVLEAETIDGTPVRGEDTVRIVP